MQRPSPSIECVCDTCCFPPSIAALSVLGRPQLIHLLDTLFELFVLALLIRVSLILSSCQLPAP